MKIKGLRLRKIGCSTGIIIPKKILDELNLGPNDEVNINLSTSKKPREGWAEAFSKYAKEVESETSSDRIVTYKVSYKVTYLSGVTSVNEVIVDIPLKCKDKEDYAKSKLKVRYYERYYEGVIIEIISIDQWN